MVCGALQWCRVQYGLVNAWWTWHNTMRLTETQIKNNAVKSVGSNTRTRQVLVMGIRQQSLKSFPWSTFLFSYVCCPVIILSCLHYNNQSVIHFSHQIKRAMFFSYTSYFWRQGKGCKHTAMVQCFASTVQSLSRAQERDHPYGSKPWHHRGTPGL